MFHIQTALIVDHDKMSARTIMQILKNDLGFQKIIVTGDGEKALELVKSGEIHWVFSEWNLKGVSGKTLLKQLRNNPKTAKVPFLMLSERIDRGALMEAITLGVTDFIAKPYTPELISKKIKKLIRGKETRNATRISPIDEFEVKIALAENSHLSGMLINLSVKGILLSMPRLTQGQMNIFDKVPLKILIGPKATVNTLATLVRMECDYDPAYEYGSRILSAFDFAEIKPEDRALLNNFINEQRGMVLSYSN